MVYIFTLELNYWSLATVLFNFIEGVDVKHDSLAINKKQNYFLLPDHELAENLILVFGFCERTKKGWKWICD